MDYNLNYKINRVELALYDHSFIPLILLVYNKRQLQNRYAAPNVDVNQYAPQGVDLGGGGSSLQHGVTQ